MSEGKDGGRHNPAVGAAKPAIEKQSGKKSIVNIVISIVHHQPATTTTNTDTEPKPKYPHGHKMIAPCGINGEVQTASWPTR